MSFKKTRAFVKDKRPIAFDKQAASLSPYLLLKPADFPTYTVLMTFFLSKTGAAVIRDFHAGVYSRHVDAQTHAGYKRYFNSFLRANISSHVTILSCILGQINQQPHCNQRSVPISFAICIRYQ